MVTVWAEGCAGTSARLSDPQGAIHEHRHQPVGIEIPGSAGSGCVHKFRQADHGLYTWSCFGARWWQRRRPIAILAKPRRET